MTILDRFVQFTQSLSDQRREEIEDMLTGIMDADENAVFSEDELSELDRRMAEDHPEYATDAEVAAAFRRTTRG